MTKKCPYPEKECIDRYMSNSKGYKCCRLDEWKKKIGVCPYNKEIHSTFKAKKMSRDKEQRTLL